MLNNFQQYQSSSVSDYIIIISIIFSVKSCDSNIYINYKLLILKIFKIV